MRIFRSGVLWMGVLAGLVILLTSLSPGQAQTVDCAPTPTSTPNPGDQEFEEDELPPLAVILAMVFFILLVFLLILLLVVLAGMILVGFILMIVSALVGLSAVIALIRQSWQDGLKALFSQLLLILFTLFGLVLGWLAAGLEINPLPVWAAILLGAVLGLAGGLVTLFSVWGIISWLEKSR